MLSKDDFLFVKNDLAKLEDLTAKNATPLVISPLKLLKDSVENACANSTAHGIPNIMRSNNWAIKILWAILFCGGVATATYCNI